MVASPEPIPAAFAGQADDAVAVRAPLIAGTVLEVPVRVPATSESALAGAVTSVGFTGRLFSPQSPIAPYGVTPNSYDMRGYTLRISPNLTDRAMADCAIDLVQSEDGQFTIGARGLKAKVEMLSGARSIVETVAAEPAKPDKPPKSKLRTAKAVLPETPTETKTNAVTATLQIAGRNRPLLEVTFPSSEATLMSKNRLPFGVVCRYELEIRPPDCRVATISRRSSHLVLGFTAETNTVGKCQLARSAN